MKAVSEKGEIVGFATWGVVSVAEGGRGVGIYGVGKELKDGEEKEDEEKKEEVKREEAKEDGVKLVQCQKLLDDTFISGDIAMAEACKGGDYYSTSSFVFLLCSGLESPFLLGLRRVTRPQNSTLSLCLQNTSDKVSVLFCWKGCWKKQTSKGSNVFWVRRQKALDSILSTVLWW